MEHPETSRWELWLVRHGRVLLRHACGNVGELIAKAGELHVAATE
jgi:hypothetical protein